MINLLLSGILNSRKIRARTPPIRQMMWEVIFSLRTILIFASVGTLIYMGALTGVIPIYTDIETYGWLWLIASTLILIIAHDAWFYWTHWLMHNPASFAGFTAATTNLTPDTLHLLLFRHQRGGGKRRLFSL